MAGEAAGVTGGVAAGLEEGERDVRSSPVTWSTKTYLAPLLLGRTTHLTFPPAVDSLEGVGTESKAHEYDIGMEVVAMAETKFLKVVQAELDGKGWNLSAWVLKLSLRDGGSVRLLEGMTSVASRELLITKGEVPARSERPPMGKSRAFIGSLECAQASRGWAFRSVLAWKMGSK